jgi:hypothetical protein
MEKYIDPVCLENSEDAQFAFVYPGCEFPKPTLATCEVLWNLEDELPPVCSD